MDSTQIQTLQHSHNTAYILHIAPVAAVNSFVAMASTSSASPHSFSIVGRNLKLDTASDIKPVLDELNQVAELREVHFGGNTLGVEACKALADVLREKKELQVSRWLLL